MKGGAEKTSKRQPTKTLGKKVDSKGGLSSQTEKLTGLTYSEFNKGQCNEPSLPRTPKRCKRQEARWTSTPVRRSPRHNHVSASPASHTAVTTRKKAAEVGSVCCKSNLRARCTRAQANQPEQVKNKGAKKKLICIKSSTPAKRQTTVTSCGQKKKTEMENLHRVADTAQPSERLRPRFELEQDESLLSSDLSIELSHHEEILQSLSFQEDEESGGDEELPSFLMLEDKKPPSITEGAFVWCKFRNFPFWPALVKRLYRKTKKASIVFIDYKMIHMKKGFTVTLKTLRPFDCEEYNDLVCKAKENWGAAIEWSLDLITDYRFRIACGSFSGSFIEYLAHDMSHPVRRKYPEATSERLTIASDVEMEDLSDDHKEESLSEQQEVSRNSKRLLPDRTHAAHNRANEKLVHFIVKKRLVEDRLLAVIRGQEHSRWLRSFQTSNQRRVVNIYLEDDEQLDQVYSYLNELYASAAANIPCLPEVESMEHVPFVLDVLLPEAIIHAIAGVDKVSVKKAEEKYLKGRCISNRERQHFDLMIEQQMKTKSLHEKPQFSTVP